MIKKYKIISLLGTTRGNEELFRKAEIYYTKLGYIVFKPAFYNLEEYNKYKAMVDEMCEEKLLLCDAVGVVTEHVGESTRNRINQALELGKEIMFFQEEIVN